MDALEQSLIDGFVEEAGPLRVALRAGVTALQDNAIDARALGELTEALEVLSRNAGFLELEALEALCRDTIRLIDRLDTEGPMIAGLLVEALVAAEEAIEGLSHYVINMPVAAGIAPRLAAALGRPASVPLAGSDLSPEAQIALLGSNGGGSDDLLVLGLDYEDEDDDEDDAVAPPAPAPALMELERVEVVEGPISDEIADFLPDYMAESDEIVERLDEQLVRLEEDSDDAALLNDIFRGAHTLKGTSGFLGLTQVADLTHKMETVLDQLRNGELPLTQDLMDVLLRAMDDLKLLLRDIRGGTLVRRDVDAVRRDLVSLAAGDRPALPLPAVPVASAAAPAEAPAPAGSAPAPPASPTREPDQIIRVDVERVDQIMNLAEELVLGRNRLLQLNAQLGRTTAEGSLLSMLSEATGQMEMLTGELQESVMSMRLVPVARVFSRFPRMVRDLARDLGKEVELTLDDGDTKIDKSVADEIGDPLVHLVRNAVDHGIESREQRIAAGKAERGRVKLAASHEGNHVILRIEDDGAGMDPEVLKAKAVERGILRPDEVEQMADHDAWDLIFAPGFSTAEAVTDVSGRGVGMDVVKTNISRLHGTITIESELGVGTRVMVRLPLTLAIIGGLQVACGDEVYIIPLTSVLEAVTINNDQVEIVQGRRAVISRGKVMPLIDLAATLGTPVSPDRAVHYVVIVGLAERRVGLLVERLLGQVDVVIKPLGQVIGAAAGIAGATILGNGDVALILDLGDLIDSLDESVNQDNASSARCTSEAAGTPLRRQ